MAESTELRYDSYITLDFDANSAYTTIAAKQTDSGSRHVLIHLTRNGQDYQLENGVIAQFRCRKPDGHAVLNIATILDDRTNVDVELTAQALAVAGRAYADVVFTKNGQYLSTVAFIIIIMAAPDITQQVVSSDEFGYIQHMADSAQDVINEAERWATGTQNGVLLDQYFVLGGTDYYTSTDFVDPPAGTTTGVVSCNWDGQAAYGTIVIGENTYYVKSIISVGNEPIQIILANPQFNNNARYYAKMLSDLTVTAVASSSATVEKTKVDEGLVTEHYNFNFGLPAGPTGPVGPQGPSTVLVKDSAPTSAETSIYDIWLQPDGELDEITLNARYILYDYTSDYPDGTVGSTLQSFNTDLLGAMALTAYSIDKTETLDARVSEIYTNLSDGINNGLNSKITNPTYPVNSGILVTSANPSRKVSWEPTIPMSYITDAPRIQSAWNSSQIYNLVGKKTPKTVGLAPANPSTTYGEYYNRPANGIPLTDLSAEVLETINGNSLINSRKNYLDNGWFIVDNRSTDVSSMPTNTYVIDRWFTGNTNEVSNINFSASSSGVHFGAGASNQVMIYQFVADDVWKSLSGKTVTLSVAYHVASRPTEFTSTTINALQTYNTTGTTTSNDGTICFSITGRSMATKAEPSNTKNGLEIGVGCLNTSGIFETTIEAVKLEIGNTSTLNLDICPSLFEEQQRCWQYYRCINTGILGAGTFFGSSSFKWIFNNDVPFAAKPSLSIPSSSSTYNMSIALSNGSSLAPTASAITSSTIDSYYNSNVYITSTVSGGSSGASGLLSLGNVSQLEFSAEYYRT